MKKLLLPALLALPILAIAEEDDAAWLDPRFNYTFDVASAYISRGKVIEDRPIQVNEATLDFGMGPFGRLGVWHWDYSSLSGHFQDKYRRFIPETDWAAFWSYDWGFAEGWSLDTEVMVEWMTYYGGRPTNDHSNYEWRMKQSLKSPWLTIYYKIRRNIEPVPYNYFQIGVKRKFSLGFLEGLTLTPHACIDLGDDRCLKKRFGALPNGAEYNDGAVSMAGELTLGYRLTDNFSLHATIGQFGVISQRGRGNLHAPQHRDLTYGQVGFAVNF